MKPDTLSPVWNELWHIKNVPGTANLNVEVLDKDNGTPKVGFTFFRVFESADCFCKDDYIGRFSTSINPGAKEVEIEGAILKRNKGTFWLKVSFAMYIPCLLCIHVYPDRLHPIYKS